MCTPFRYLSLCYTLLQWQSSELPPAACLPMQSPSVSQLACPSPYCNLFFPNDDAICLHLGDTSTECAKFAANYFDTLDHERSATYESDDNDGMHYILASLTTLLIAF
jgi:hypothetical protein